MHLAADHLSIDFPLAAEGERHSLASKAGSDPLGGRIHFVGKKPFVRALDDLSFELHEGDRLALVGHNGCGKSTLLRVLAGIYHPTGGRIRASGTVSGIFNMSLGFRHEASGYRNLVLKGLMAGRTLAQIDAALPEIAEFTGLGPYLDMPLHTYSQGMAMRLAFAATTAFTTDILVMDEWIGAGDASFQEKIIARLGDFVHAPKVMVLASHSATLLRRIANKAIWLEQGRIRMAGGTSIIDDYEASILPQQLSPSLRALVENGTGLWSTPGDSAMLSTPYLLWNLPPGNEELQLLVYRGDGRRQVVRSSVLRMGAWPFAPWVQPGMVFELGNQSIEQPVASFEIPNYRNL